MKGIILAAGLGTRLLPLTEELPKALVPIVNRPIIDIIIDSLKKADVNRIGVNLHHKPDMIRRHLETGEHHGVSFHFNFEKEVLETGGGLAQFKNFIGDDPDFILHNCDPLTDINLAEAIKFHREHNPLATLVLIDNPPKNTVMIDSDCRVIDIAGSIGVTPMKNTRLLCGAAVFIYSSKIFQILPDTGKPYPIIPILLKHLRKHRDAIMGYVAEKPRYWRDIGNLYSYQAAHRDILSGNAPPFPGVETGKNGTWIHPDAKIARNVRTNGFICVHQGAVVEEGVELTDAILWKNARVPAESRIISAIISENNTVHV